MQEYLVSVQIIKTYNISIEANSAIEAENKVAEMDALDISEQGSLKQVDVEYAEVIG
jgi:hypothetical protein